MGLTDGDPRRQETARERVSSSIGDDAFGTDWLVGDRRNTAYERNRSICAVSQRRVPWHRRRFSSALCVMAQKRRNHFTSVRRRVVRERRSASSSLSAACSLPWRRFLSSQTLIAGVTDPANDNRYPESRLRLVPQSPSP